MEYAMNLIPQQTEKVRQCINQSHLLYLQPNMERKIEIFVESLIEVKSRYCHETNTPYTKRVDYDTEEPWEIEELDGVDDIDEVLQGLKENLEYEIKDNGGVDDILIHDIVISITIRVLLVSLNHWREYSSNTK